MSATWLGGEPVMLPEAPTSKWWDPTDMEDRGPALWRYARWIEMKQAAHHKRLLYNALRYSNRELAAFDWGWGRYLSSSLVPYRENAENLILSIIDTMVATVGKNKVKARPLTKNASFKLRRVSRKLDRYLYGEAKRLDFWELAKDAFRDACWGEIGTVFGYYDPREGVCLERVFPDEMIVDNTLCPSDLTPPVQVRRRPMHIDTLLDMWGDRLTQEQKDLLIEDSRTNQGWTSERAPAPGWLIVLEGFRQKYGDKPGRHVVGTHSVTILDEEWKYSWMPFVHFHWMRPPSGFYCPSACEQADPYQKRLDEINSVIRDAQDLMARPRIWLQTGGKLQLTQLDNRIGRVLQSSVEPKPLVWSAVSPELYNERERQVRIAYEYFGLTQLSAQGKLPAGARLDSSEALNEYNQIQDDRLADIAQRYERFQLAMYNLIINLSERAAKDGENLKTTWVAGRRVQEINWKDVDFDKDRYVIHIEPASTMSESSAAQKDLVMKLASSQVLSRDQLLMMLDTPDLEREVSLMVAAAEDIERTAEILEDGDYEPPSPLQDLVKGVQRIHYIYLRLKTDYDDVPESVLESMERWIRHAMWIMQTGADQAKEAQDPGTSAPQVMPPQQGGMPTQMGAPMQPQPMPPQGMPMAGQ
jgi:hypothetical protein